MASSVLRTTVLLCILALAIAHRVPGHDYDPSISSDANGADGMLKFDDALSPISSMKFENGVVPNGRTAKCAKKCSFKCLPKFLEGPVSYAFCFAKCTLKCKFLGPFSAAGDCTLDCARSITTSHLQSQHTSIAETTRYVEGYVDSCYQSCSKYQNDLKN